MAGETVILECNTSLLVTTTPIRNLRFEWMRLSGGSLPRDRFRFSQNRQTMVISNLTIADGQVYLCIVQSSETFEAFTLFYRLNVNRKVWFNIFELIIILMNWHRESHGVARMCHAYCHGTSWRECNSSLPGNRTACPKDNMEQRQYWCHFSREWDQRSCGCPRWRWDVDNQRSNEGRQWCLQLLCTELDCWVRLQFYGLHWCHSRSPKWVSEHAPPLLTCEWLSCAPVDLRVIILC